MFHFLIVLFTIFAVFVMVGHLSFGREISYFSTPAVAVDTCGMMMLGFVIDDIRDDMVLVLRRVKKKKELRKYSNEY